MEMMHRIYKKNIFIYKHIAERKDKTKQFLQDQIKEIEKYKYLCSEKAGRDLGQECVFIWIEKYAAQYRKQWEEKHGKIIEEDKNGMCHHCGKRKQTRN
jgi:hypothetical protein